MNTVKRVFALMLVLALALCLAACGENATTPTTTAPTTTAPVPTTTASVPATTAPTYNYKIRVVDQDGNPIAGAFVIFCLEQCNFYQTGEDGWALIDVEITDGYQAHIMSLPEGYEGYTFSEEYTNFESGQTEMILVATKPAE